MKYYSEKLRKVFDEKNDCLKAEKEFDEKQAEEKRKKEELSQTRKIRAKEVELALKDATAARKHYEEVLTAFCKDFGTFHCSFSDGSAATFLSNLVEWF